MLLPSFCISPSPNGTSPPQIRAWSRSTEGASIAVRSPKPGLDRAGRRGVPPAAIKPEPPDHRLAAAIGQATRRLIEAQGGHVAGPQPQRGLRLGGVDEPVDPIQLGGRASMGEQPQGAAGLDGGQLYRVAEQPYEGTGLLGEGAEPAQRRRAGLPASSTRITSPGRKAQASGTDTPRLAAWSWRAALPQSPENASPQGGDTDDQT
jgi:hypothetical protein